MVTLVNHILVSRLEIFLLEFSKSSFIKKIYHLDQKVLGLVTVWRSRSADFNSFFCCVGRSVIDVLSDFQLDSSDPRTWELVAPTIDPTSSWLLPRSTAIG